MVLGKFHMAKYSCHLLTLLVPMLQLSTGFFVTSLSKASMRQVFGVSFDKLDKGISPNSDMKNFRLNNRVLNYWQRWIRMSQCFCRYGQRHVQDV